MTRHPRKNSRARKRPPKIRKPAKAIAPRRDPLDEFIASGANALGLKIDRAWMPAVRTHLAVTLRHGAKVAEIALPDDAEPAPVFEA